MAGLSASGLKTQIKSYTETDSNVLTDSVLENIILNAQYRIFRDVPIDADRKQQLGNFVAGQESINCPAGALFIRGIQVYDTAGSETTGANRWLEKKDYTYLQEYQDVTGTSAAQGQPKYYAMFGGGTGESDTTSGRIFVSPTPNTTYRFRGVPTTSPGTGTATNPVFAYASIPNFDGITGSNIAKSAGYAITTGLYKDDAAVTTDYATSNYFHFTVDTDTATVGGKKGGGYGCSVGPVTIEG